MTALSGGKALESSVLKREREIEEGARKKLVLVVFTSDRGLCGGFNSSIIKRVQRMVAASQAEYESIELMFVGRKGYEFFRTKAGFKVGQYFSEFGGKVTFANAKKLSDTLIEAYVSGQADEIKFVFNEFLNAISQRAATLDFLPLKPAQVEAADSNGKAAVATDDQTMYIVRPSYDAILQELIGKNFSVQAYRVMLESQAGEHGARMSSMENATKNAGEMIKKLSLQYNKQRQANITKELLEIIAGSESQKS